MADRSGKPGIRLEGLVSLVIPVHNESENMARVIPAVRTALAQLTASFEVVLVDDGSTDSTVTVAKEQMGEQGDQLRVVSHLRQSGYGITVADGLRAAAGDWVAFVDGDGQFDPLDLRLLAELADEGDLIAGWRIHRADPWHRSVVSGTFNVLVRILYGIHYRDVDCGFKLIRRSVLEAASPILARSALLNTELYFKARRSGFRIRQVGIVHHPRIAGVRAGGRLVPILRAVREVFRLRLALARGWRPPAPRQQQRS
ncbi:MAG: glycosyltransferase family 2 protein [Candidatus Dormibacteria bacterium]